MVEVEVEEEVSIHSYTMYLSARFYENEPNEICNYLSEKERARNTLRLA